MNYKNYRVRLYTSERRKCQCLHSILKFQLTKTLKIKVTILILEDGIMQKRFIKPYL